MSQIEDLQRLWASLRREPRRVLPWLALVVLLGIAGSLLNEGVRRLVFPEKPDANTRRTVVLDARFAQVLREQTDLAENLGDAVADPVSCGATMQPFETGFTLWTTEEPEILLACDDSTRSCEHFTHPVTTASDDNYFNGLPQDIRQLFNPTGGFRAIWVHHRLRNRLGLPLAAEKPLNIMVQRFKGGMLLRDIPWFRRSDRQFLPLPEIQPVLAIIMTNQHRSVWSYHGKYGA